MAEVYGGADGVRFYLTGAASDGAAQSDPAASLGKYRSSTRFDSLGISVAGGPANVTVDYASGKNGPGNGTLTTKSVNSLSWTAPGGSEGATVTIANGQTKVLPSANTDKFVVVTRTSAADLSGNATVTLADVYNNLWDNVGDAERVAGDTERRCLALKVHSAADIASLKLWLGTLATGATVNASGYAASGEVTITAKVGGAFAAYGDYGFLHNDRTNEVMCYDKVSDDALHVAAGGRNVWGDGAAAGLEDDAVREIPYYRIGKEAPGSQPSGSFTDYTGSGEGGSAPVTCYHPISAADAEVVNVGALTAGYIYGLWIERKIIAGAPAEAYKQGVIELSFESVD